MKSPSRIRKPEMSFYGIRKSWGTSPLTPERIFIMNIFRAWLCRYLALSSFAQDDTPPRIYQQPMLRR